jgi:hypothetical protein
VRTPRLHGRKWLANAPERVYRAAIIRELETHSHRQGVTVKRIALPLLALVLSLGVLLPNVAHAVLMRVDFTLLTSASDPTYTSQTVSGYFTYDSSIVPSGGGQLGSGNLSALSLTLAGHTYSTADADDGFLTFDSAGSLTDWFIGGTYTGVNAVSTPGPDFWLGPDYAPTYTYPGAPDGIYFGSLSSWSVAPAPTAAAEPGTLALLVPGLLPLGIMLRRRKKS